MYPVQSATLTRNWMIRVIRLPEDQIEAAKEILAAAYFNEPYAVAFEPDDGRRLDAWRRGFAPDVRYCLCHGEPHLALRKGRPVGVALWMPPHVEPPMPEVEREFGLDGLQEIFGQAYIRFLPLERLLLDMRRESMNRPHWFLRLLGIDPSEAYEEVGRALVG
jgi:hypothetical protein